MPNPSLWLLLLVSCTLIQLIDADQSLAGVQPWLLRTDPATRLVNASEPPRHQTSTNASSKPIKTQTWVTQHGNNFTIVDAQGKMLAFVAFPERDFGDLTVSEDSTQPIPLYETSNHSKPLVKAPGGAVAGVRGKRCDARCKRAKQFVQRLFFHSGDDARREPQFKGVSEHPNDHGDAIRGLGNLFSPTECRSKFNERVVDKALEGENVQAVLSVTDQECGLADLHGDNLSRFTTGVTCGVLIFTYSVVTVETGTKASFIYYGKRGWNMWGNAGWDPCRVPDISKVVNFKCDEERPATRSDACY